MENTIQRNRTLGQSTWVDYIRRDMLTSGELDELIATGVTGLTSNPTIFEKAIAGSALYDSALDQLAGGRKSPAEIFEALAIEDIGDAADALRSVYDSTNGADGYASIEVDPTLAHDTVGTVSEARRLWARLQRPNVLIKVPATPEGIPAITQLIGAGINVNVTLIFALDAYRQVMDAHIAGIETLVRGGGDPSHVASVASFFVSRVDSAADALLDQRSEQGESSAAGLRGRTAIANAQAAYALFKERYGRPDFQEFTAKGARAQRPLWASTSTKDPAYPDTMYVDTLIGPDTVNTMPPDTLQAVLDHGTSSPTLEGSGAEATAVLDALRSAGVDMEAVTSKLLTDGVASFANSFNNLLASIDAKCSELAKSHS